MLHFPPKSGTPPFTSCNVQVYNASGSLREAEARWSWHPALARCWSCRRRAKLEVQWQLSHTFSLEPWPHYCCQVVWFFGFWFCSVLVAQNNVFCYHGLESWEADIGNPNMPKPFHESLLAQRHKKQERVRESQRESKRDGGR